MDKFTDGGVSVVVVATNGAVNLWLCDISNLDVCDSTTVWPEADNFIVDAYELLLNAVTSLDEIISDEGVADTFTDATMV